jgi:hypothetical protein
MATINIKYNPSISVFFNSDGKLVIGDVNGDYGNGNENGWGGYNPPKSSITVATLMISNQATGDTYLLTGSVDDFDLLPTGLYDTTNQILIEADIYTDISNIYTSETRSNTATQFEQGIYTLSFAFQGTYTFGGDTINWSTDAYNSPVFITGVVNLNSTCIENILRKVSFAKRCKQDKKFSYLNMYLNMLYEFQNYITLSGLTITDYTQRVVKVGAILAEIQGLCNGKNKCKC